MRIPLYSHTLQIGPYEGRHFTYTESYEPGDQRAAEYGRIFIAMEANVHPDLGNELKRAIVDTLIEEYYADLSRDPYESFEQALQKVNDALGNLSVKGVNDWIGKLNACIAILNDATLHLTQTGSASMYLVRGESATNISSGLSPKPDEVRGDKTFFNISSGTLLQGDFLLLITNANYDSVAARDLVHVLRSVNFTDRSGVGQKLGSLNVRGTPVDILAIRVGTGARAFGNAMEYGEEPVIHETDQVPMVGMTGTLAQHARRFFQTLKNSIGRRTEQTESETPELYGTGDAGQSRLSNTVQLLKDNSLKNFERLFSRKHGVVSSPRRSSKRLVVWLVIILLLIGGSYWLIQQRKASMAHQEMVQMLGEIRDGKGIAKTRAIYEPESAKNLVLSLERKAQRIIDESNDPELREEARVELTELNELLDRVDDVFRIAAPKIAYDLSIERPSVKARGIFSFDGQLYAFDQNALYKLVLDQIDTRKVIVGQQDDVEVIDADGFTQEKEIVLLTKDNGIVEYKDGSFAFGVSQDGTWKAGTAITDYDNLRIVYVLDPTGSEVWKYSRSRAGFDSPSKKNIATQDLSTAVDVTIDGAIYVLRSDGTIVKYFDDKLSTFEFTGLTQPLNAPVSLYADSDFDAGFLYILDAGNKRVVVTSKGGEYIAQYVLDSAENLVDLYVDEENDLIYALEENGKVYEITIEHY